MVRFELLISEVTAQPTHLQSSWWLSEWLVIITACNVNLATFIILAYLLKFVNSKPLILFLLVWIIRQTKPKAKNFSCRCKNFNLCYLCLFTFEDRRRQIRQKNFDVPTKTAYRHFLPKKLDWRFLANTKSTLLKNFLNTSGPNFTFHLDQGICMTPGSRHS